MEENFLDKELAEYQAKEGNSSTKKEKDKPAVKKRNIAVVSPSFPKKRKRSSQKAMTVFDFTSDDGEQYVGWW